jgi:glycosyltransferase involved in cell wall biosynthesis
MRVVMLSKACIVGQYQTKLEEIAKQSDIELTVVVPPFWRDERGILSLERAYTRGYTLRIEPIRFNGQFHLHYYPTFDHILREIRPDVVHIDEEPYNLATFLAMRAARRVQAKTLFFTWQNILRRYPPPFSWMEAYVLHHANYAIAGSMQAKAVLHAKKYSGRVRIIPQFGVDPDMFRPIAQSPDRHPIFRIGYVGRLVEEKGCDLLLEAVARLEGAWDLHLLGSGPERINLEARARQLRIASRVYFHIPLPSTKMPAFYQKLDVLVLPSLTRPNWKEQFGRVLIEAMACQVPVIGSSCGEIPNVIGDAGLVFPEGDISVLHEQLGRLRDHPALRLELGKRGRERVLERFTQARIAQETVAVYSEMLCQ